MQCPILLSTGAIARYPLGRKSAYATRLTQFADRSVQSFSAIANPLGSWALNLSMLPNSEAQDWIEFFAAMKGQGNPFIFADPWDNLLSWTEEFENSVWQKGSGLLIGKNYLLNSENLSVSPWTSAGNGGTAPTVTPNFATAPDGNLTASKLAFAGATGSQTPAVFQSATISQNASMTFTFSIWLKTDTTGSIKIVVQGGSPLQVGTSVTCSLTNQWQRFSAKLTFNSTPGNSTVQVNIFQDSSVGAAINVYAWGAQLEYGSVPSDYTKTTSAATELQIADPFWKPAPSSMAGASFGLNSAFPKRARQIVAISNTNVFLLQTLPLIAGGSGNYRTSGLSVTNSAYFKLQGAGPVSVQFLALDDFSLEESSVTVALT